MTWDCADIAERLDDYLDSEMSSDDAKRFDVHLKSCAACAAQVAIERRLIGDLALLGEVSDWIADGGREVADTQTNSLVFARLQVGAMAAAIVLMMTATLFVPSTTSPTIPPAVVDVQVDSNQPQSKPPVEPYVELQDRTRLAVRVPSADERIHIFWMYDTVATNNSRAESINSN